MEAVIIVAGKRLTRLSGWSPPMLHCVDRPVLQHIAEILVDQGIVDLHFVLHDEPERIEKLFGDGERWGCRFTYHLVMDPAHPYGALRLIGNGQASEAILLVHADRLPLPANGTALGVKGAHRRVLCYSKETDGISSAAWTGWAWIDGEIAHAVPEDADEAALECYFVGKGLMQDTAAVQEVLDFRSFEGALRAQSCILTNPELSAHLLAREVESGIWLGRNVMLHPSAQLIAPAYIGENSRIEEGAKIGPNAVIGCDSIVDTFTTVRQSAVYPGSYCGQGLALDHVFVDRNRLLDCRVESQLNVSDSFILSSLKGADHGRWARSAVSMIAAAILTILTLPIAFATGLVLLLTRGKIGIEGRQVLRVPASENEAEWKFFTLWSFRNQSVARQPGLIRWLLLDFIPALPKVACGYLRLIGVEPRTLQELEEMPEDWKALFLKTHIGLITEAFVLHGSSATADQTYSSEVCYAITHNIWHDLALAGRFISRTLTAQHDF